MQAIESVATVLVEVVIASIPAGWERGPLPISYLDGRGTTVVTDAGARATYFHPRACATLYGGDTDRDQFVVTIRAEGRGAFLIRQMQLFRYRVQ